MRANSILATAALILGLLHAPAAFAQDGEGDADQGDDKAQKAAGDAADGAKKVSKRSRRKARKQFKLGARLAGEQRYDEAIAAFSKAYEFDPQPDTLYNLGTVSRLKGDARGAYEYYQKYLAVAPNGSLARSAKRFMKGLEDQIAEEDARLAREQDLKAQAEKTRLEAERARQEAEKAKLSQEEMLAKTQADLAESQKQMALVQKERDNLDQTLRANRGATKRLIGVSLLAAGGLALGLGIKSGLDASSANSELNSLGMDDSWGQGYEWLHQHGQSSQTRMILFSVTGALLVGGGVTMYLLGNRESKQILESSEPAVSLTPAISPKSAGLQVTGRF